MDEAIRVDGFRVVEGVLDHEEVSRLIALVEGRLAVEAGRGGMRNLLEVPEMLQLAQSEVVRLLVEPVLGAAFFPVRGILFDKTHGGNWKVPWHQDVTIAVEERIEVPGFGPWSTKAGVLHVQPSASVLEGMLTVRVHLDDCPGENGALRVVAGTHDCGKVSATEAARIADESASVMCEVKAGGALLMRPLLVHASSAAARPVHRRVLHFDFAARELPGGLRWASQA